MNEKEIVKLYTKNNKSTYELAELFDTYPNKIRRILIKNGVEIKDKSEAQKNALKKGVAKIPTKGMKRSKEEKLKISETMRQHWSNMDDKTYAKRVKMAKDRWDKMTDVSKEMMMQSAIKAIQLAGKEGSKLEKFLRKELASNGYKVEAHKKTIIQNENLEIDMYFPELNTVIEIDGPSHFLPIWGEEKLQKQIKADSHKTGLILSKGMAIIRVKTLSDSLSLSAQEELKNKLLETLSKIKQSFPKKSERYIEIET